MRFKFFITLVILILVSLLVSACGEKTAGLTPAVQQATEPVAYGNDIPASTPNPLKDPIIISAVESKAGLETIYVTNISNVIQDITGFSLIIPETSEHINFPETKLEPGTSLRVYNGSGASLQTDGVFWRDQIILKLPGDSIILLNHAGRVIWYYTKR
jgi:hypothetical protein